MNRYINSFVFNENSYYYYDLKKVFERYPSLKKLPNSLKILLETNIRNANINEIESTIDTFVKKNNLKQIEFYPSRVIMEDFTGIPSLIDLASIRDEFNETNKNAETINPQILFDLILDSSTTNKEKLHFLKWAEHQFKNFSIIPPNLENYPLVNQECLSTMLSVKTIDKKNYIFPETLVGTNYHISITNTLGILGLKVDEIEAQSAMLGSNLSMNFPKVLGVEIVGSLAQGVCINDALLSLINLIDEKQIFGNIVEFYGNGLKNIEIEDRIILSMNAKKYNSICGYFGIDENTISYIEKTRGVDGSFIKEYFYKQEIYDSSNIEYDEYIKLDLSSVKPTIIGPKKIEDKISVKDISSKLQSFKKGTFVKDNDIVLANISSNTLISNPTLLIQGALVAKRACEMGLKINNNIKCLLTLDSFVEQEYLKKLDLLKYLEKLGFYILTSQELKERVSLDIDKYNLNVSSVNSGFDDFEKINYPQIKSNWLMSPALVIAYCVKGNMNFDITKDALCQDIYLSDIWPSCVEISNELSKLDYTFYQNIYKDVFLGNENWQNIEYENTSTYNWDENSTYIQASKLFEDINHEKIYIKDAKILALLGNDISTDYISPSNNIISYSPVAIYLKSKGLMPDEFGTYENRYSNAEVMTRATLSNSRLKNKIVYPKEGGFTKDFESGEILSLYDFSTKVKNENPLVLFAGTNFGKGKENLWAAKGIRLLGVKVVIAKSFDYIYKSNLISIGVLPLEFIGDDIDTLKLKGDELVTIKSDEIKINNKIEVDIKKDDEIKSILVQSKLDSKDEILYYKNGGVLPYLLKNI